MPLPDGDVVHIFRRGGTGVNSSGAGSFNIVRGSGEVIYLVVGGRCWRFRTVGWIWDQRPRSRWLGCRRHARRVSHA